MKSEIILELEERMEKAVEHFSGELKGIRTGRATTALVDNIKVDYYGSLTPLKQLANISVPDARMIQIKPFDMNSLKEIEKAILKSDIGLTPNNDGKLIRINVPTLSEDRRKKLVSQVKDMAEQSKISIRNIRRDGNKSVDKAEKDSDAPLSEDEAKRMKNEIQDLTKKYEKQVDDVLSKKSEEILKI